MIDLALTAEQETFAKSAAAIVERHNAGGQPDAPAALWSALADLGVLGICAPSMGGTPLDLVVAMEALGARSCPGPLVATAAASVVLDEDGLDALVNGDLRVTLVGRDLVPWAPSTALAIELAEDGAWVVDIDDLSPVRTMSGEPWSRGRATRTKRLGDSGGAIVLANLAAAAYLLGAAVDLVARAAEHARVRVQFKRPIGDFQAVAHPLARSHAEVRATAELVRLVARNSDAGTEEARSVRAVAVRASRSACERVHQAFGAVGFAEETGVAAITTRIQQWAALPLTTD